MKRRPPRVGLHLSELYGAFTWYPVNDEPSDKSLNDAVITTHGRDVAVFNGELVSRSRHGDATTSRWHLDAPAASYLVTLAIGPYSRSTVVTPDGMRTPTGSSRAIGWC